MSFSLQVADFALKSWFTPASISTTNLTTLCVIWETVCASYLWCKASSRNTSYNLWCFLDKNILHHMLTFLSSFHNIASRASYTRFSTKQHHWLTWDDSSCKLIFISYSSFLSSRPTFFISQFQFSTSFCFFPFSHFISFRFLCVDF